MKDNVVKIKIKRLNPTDADIPLPTYMSLNASGMDIYAAVEKDVLIKKGDIYLVPTGFAVSIPKGFEAQIRPRSGLAVKKGISIINAPGTIDADYRGEIKVAIINLGKNDFTLKRGDRIAQMVINQVFKCDFETVVSLDNTKREDGGFGHTGI